MTENEASAIPAGEQPYSTVEPDRQTTVVAVDPNNPPWEFGGAVLVFALSIWLVVLIPSFIVMIYALSQGHRIGTPEENQALAQFITTDKTSIILQILALLPIHLTTMVVVWALVTNFGKRPFWPAIGWSWGRWSPAKGLAISTLLGIGLFLVGSAIAKVLGGDKPTPLEQIINSSLTARYLISFFAVATAPLVEEFVYRGVLFAPLQKLFGATAAVVVVLIIFTGIHVPQYWPNAGVITAVFLLSAALTILRAKTGRLLPCVVVHFVFNGIQAVLLVIEPYLQGFMPTPEPVTPPALILLPLIGMIT